MRYLVVMTLLAASCSGDSNNDNSATPVADMGSDTASAADMAGSGDTGASDQGSTPDVSVGFCGTADCSGDTPQCSELLQRCVQCTANNDCATAPLLTCETIGDGMGGDPSYECVECVDDTVCAGGTCDLTTHTCM